MLSLGPIAFTAPLFLLGLLALPLFYWLIRLFPPAPKLIRFPAVRLLFGLKEQEREAAAAPIWLILLRLAIPAAFFIAAAQPVLNPETALEGDGPVTIIIDDGWAAAPQWDVKRQRLIGLIGQIERAGRGVKIFTGTRMGEAAVEAGGETIMAPSDAREMIRGLEPNPWPVDRAALQEAVRTFPDDGSADIYWAHNGLHDPLSEDIANRLQEAGRLRILLPDGNALPLLLYPPDPRSRDITVTIRRVDGTEPFTTAAIAYAEDGRPLMRQLLRFEAGETETEITFPLPDALRNELARIGIEPDGETQSGASGVALLDERWRSRPIGILTGGTGGLGIPLLSETYYLDRALQPIATVSQGPAPILLRSEQAVLVQPDEAAISQSDRMAIAEWVEDGGVLIRFAGPRLALSEEEGLLPVTLRRGGRQLSGSLQWSEPARIGSVAEGSPFAGLTPPKDVVIHRQVLAQPSLDLDSRTWMRLEDNTPLVTGAERGDGWIVLVHTSANTRWSTLGLSGLFPNMLERLAGLSRGIRSEDSLSSTLPPLEALNGLGVLDDPPPSARPIDRTRAEEIRIGPDHPPGYYGTRAGRFALNLTDRIPAPERLDAVPANATALGYETRDEQPLGDYFIALALALFLIDGFVTLVFQGHRLKPSRTTRAAGNAGAAGLALIVVLATTFGGRGALAQTEAELDRLLTAADGAALGYVVTGVGDVDAVSRAGLRGLAEILRNRTAIVPSPPLAVDLSEDELSLFPLLYWPVVDGQERLAAPTVDKLNRYLANGGMILFDTRDSNRTEILSGSMPLLRRVTNGMDIPPLEPVPADHVLTKSFYLLNEFPGRWSGGNVWVQRAGSGGGNNDNVSPVVVGGADWAAAWAMDDVGRPLYPVVPGGDRQREIAYRFGINLLMYTLTGNYKADQVHVPAILERLGQ